MHETQSGGWLSPVYALTVQPESHASQSSNERQRHFCRPSICFMPKSHRASRHLWSMGLCSKSHPPAKGSSLITLMGRHIVIGRSRMRGSWRFYKETQRRYLMTRLVTGSVHLVGGFLEVLEGGKG